MQDRKKAAVYLDNSGALFIAEKNGFAVFSESLESGYESHPRHQGEGSNQARFGRDPYHGSNNEYRIHLQEIEHKNRYFDKLEKALQVYDDILLFGPGLTKKELYHHLLNQRAFHSKVLQVQNSNHLSEKQLLETARTFFAFSGKVQTG